MESNEREFRNALGRYPTGVTVICTHSPDGGLVGLTANSVTAVGVDPVSLAWNLGIASRTRAIFEAADYFAVNVLAGGQVDVARQFAAPVANRYESINYSIKGPCRLPKINGVIAWYACRRTDIVEVGDHIMFLGDVVESEVADGPPLLYFAGQFAQAH